MQMKSICCQEKEARVNTPPPPKKKNIYNKVCPQHLASLSFPTTAAAWLLQPLQLLYGSFR